MYNIQKCNLYINRENLINIVENIGSYKTNIIEKLNNNSFNGKEINIILDGMSSSDPGITVNSLEGLKNCILWWCNDEIEIVIIIDNFQWNLSKVCWVNKKDTSIKRYQVLDSTDLYEKILVTDVLYNKVLNRYKLPYNEIRPMDENLNGYDLNEFTDDSKWFGFYGGSEFAWFIKNIFNKQLANIAIIKED